MATVSDLIKGSLRLIGAIAQGETPAASELSDGLTALNDMLGSWGTESLLVYTKVEESLTLVASQAAYTMGSGGDLDTTRPQRIENALIKDSNDTYFPVEIINRDQWAAIPQRDTESTIPTRLYLSGSNPLETLNLWPVPSVANTLVVFSWKPFSTFSATSDTVTFPPGYAKALRYNLALELAPEYGITPDGLVMQSAMESKANIKRMNSKPELLVVDAAVRPRSGTFDWRTGE